jgi:chemotaxis protein MotA
MDLASIIGLVLGVVVVGVVMILDGGSPAELFSHPAAILLIVGGSVAATMITLPLEAVMKLPKFISLAFIQKKRNPLLAIEQISEMADKARREGLLALEEESKKIDEPFLKKGIMLVVDGIEPAQVRTILELEIDHLNERHEVGIGFFASAGGFAPTFGIIGTVMGLISVLKQLSDPDKLAKSIASAFLATLWGLLVSNLMYLPLAGKLTLRNNEEIAYNRLLMEGILSLQAGENPRLVKEKLYTFLPPSEREGGKEKGEAKKAGAQQA